MLNLSSCKSVNTHPGDLSSVLFSFALKSLSCPFLLPILPQRRSLPFTQKTEVCCPEVTQVQRQFTLYQKSQEGCENSCCSMCQLQSSKVGQSLTETTPDQGNSSDMPTGNAPAPPCPYQSTLQRK